MILRWPLFIILALGVAGFLLLLSLAGGFRRSFGASDIHPLVAVLPPVAAGILLAALLLPGQAWLLHSAALTALLVAALCIRTLLIESPTTFWIVFAFLAGWSWYYAEAAWWR